VINLFSRHHVVNMLDINGWIQGLSMEYLSIQIVVNGEELGEYSRSPGFRLTNDSQATDFLSHPPANFYLRRWVLHYFDRMAFLYAFKQTMHQF
jgi:hypothetical protein